MDSLAKKNGWIPKIGKFLPIFSLINLNACQLFSSPSHQSQWTVLDQASDLNCEHTSQPDNTIDMRSLLIIEGAKPLIVPTSIDRRGLPVHHFQQFALTLKGDEYSKLPLPRRAKILGGKTANARAIVAIAFPNQNGMSVQIRDIKSNTVMATVDTKATRPTGGQLADSWISVADEEGETRVFFIEPDLRTIREIPGIRFTDEIQILPIQENGKAALIAVWERSNKFFYRKITAKGDVSKIAHFNIQIEDGLDAWKSIYHNSKIWFAVVDGDTLVGKAALKVLSGELGGGLKPTLNTRLDDIHTSGPRFFVEQDKLYLAFVAWLDGEATILRYGLDQQDPKRIANGIFQQGSRLEQGFRYDETWHFIVRSKIEGRWSYVACEL